MDVNEILEIIDKSQKKISGYAFKITQSQLLDALNYQTRLLIVALTKSVYHVVQYTYDLSSCSILIYQTLEMIEKSQKKIGEYTYKIT